MLYGRREANADCKKAMLFGSGRREEEVDDFFKTFRSELDGIDLDNVSTIATVDSQSVEQQMAKLENCKGCETECGNQEAHYEGCLNSVIAKDDAHRIFH